ncbi:hypothetical protein CRUP_016672 [Coryphaenoides rupestris]|nr:hypothetical protein CRUP_016672 [Coryphaenoides rupestris]
MAAANLTREALRERRLSGWSKCGLRSCSFSRHTPVGDCTSSEEVPDAWSLSPSEPTFRFSWTMSGQPERAMVTLWEHTKGEGVPPPSRLSSGIGMATCKDGGSATATLLKLKRKWPFSSMVICSASSERDSSMVWLPRRVWDRRRLNRFIFSMENDGVLQECQRAKLNQPPTEPCRPPHPPSPCHEPTLLHIPTTSSTSSTTSSSSSCRPRLYTTGSGYISSTANTAAAATIATMSMTARLWQEAEAAAVSGAKDGTGADNQPAPLRTIFMQGADASHFFRRRSRRAVKSQAETDAEQRQVLAADERRREFHEAKRAQFESHAEEEGDEQDERSQESTEQWREFHHDGMYPPHEYNRQAN